ncbi:MAG: hypothetical protein LUG83_08635, partial [Lachnospiraceae bacterium]|nr:hypothetical protein [Lachnospiraceae bacterium]
MKRLLAVVLLVMLSFGLVACQGKTEMYESTEQEPLDVSEDIEIFTDVPAQDGRGTESLIEEKSFLVTEIESYPFEEEPSQFVLTDLCPCVVVDGAAYLYENGSWNEIQSDEKLVSIYSGDIFCGLTSDGEIVVGSEEWDEYES